MQRLTGSLVVERINPIRSEELLIDGLLRSTIIVRLQRGRFYFLEAALIDIKKGSRFLLTLLTKVVKMRFADLTARLEEVEVFDVISDPTHELQKLPLCLKSIRQIFLRELDLQITELDPFWRYELSDVRRGKETACCDRPL